MTTAAYTPSSLAPRTASHLDELQRLRDENERLERRVHELTTALQQAGAALDERDETIAKLNASLRFEYDARRNKELGTGISATLIAVHRQIQHTAADADGWHLLYIGGARDEHGKPRTDGLAGATGQGRKTVAAHLKAIAATDFIELKTVETRNAGGTLIPRTYARPGSAYTTTPAELKLPKPRNHGGRPDRCGACGSKMKLIARVYRCEGCGDEHTEPTKHTGRQDNNRCRTAADARGAMFQDDTSEIDNQRAAAVSPMFQDDTRLHAWLVELAGDGTRHIEMQRGGASKYEWRRGAVTAALVERHLRGDVVAGSTLRRGDGRTSMLEWDVDTEPRYAELEAAGVKLRASGAYVLVEPSPARRDDGTRRGGRLRVLFASLVDTASARATALHHAPELAGIVEYWPNDAKGQGQATRLPFAHYRRGDVDEPCVMTFGDGQVLAGLDAARRAFTDERTPAAWVTVEPETPDGILPFGTPAPVAEPRRSLVISPAVVPDTRRVEPAALRDATWLAKYGGQADTCYFAFTEAYTVEHFKARQSIADVLPLETNGYARATWRGERTPSVKVTPDGFVDYGANATIRAGDVLEAYCLKYGRERAAVLQDTACTIVRAAHQALKAAAATNSGNLPAWLVDIITPAGWRHYDALRANRQPIGDDARRSDIPPSSDAPRPTDGQLEHVECLLAEADYTYALRYMTRIHGLDAWPPALVATARRGTMA